MKPSEEVKTKKIKNIKSNNKNNSDNKSSRIYRINLTEDNGNSYKVKDFKLN